jgi:hypothetical protein
MRAHMVDRKAVRKRLANVSIENASFAGKYVHHGNRRNSRDAVPATFIGRRHWQTKRNLSGLETVMVESF